jgi:hypothetical protein
VSSRLVIAVVAATVVACGLVGFGVYAVWGDSSEPTGLGLEPAVNAESPATAGPSASPPPLVGAAPPEAPAAPPGGGPGATSGEGTLAGDDVAPGAGPADTGPDEGEPGLEPATPIGSLEPLASDAELPTPGSDPVELPALLPPPASFASSPGTPLSELDPADVDGLGGWDVVTRSDDYLLFARGSERIEVFGRGAAPDATTALAGFVADLDDDMSTLDVSAPTLLASPDPRWMSVVGTEYSATRSGQQTTTAITGSIVAAVATDGSTVVLTTSRHGPSTAAQRFADGAVLNVLLAAVNVG